MRYEYLRRQQIEATEDSTNTGILGKISQGKQVERENALRETSRKRVIKRDKTGERKIKKTAIYDVSESHITMVND